MVEALFVKYLCEQGLVNGWEELGNVQKDSRRVLALFPHLFNVVDNLNTCISHGVLYSAFKLVRVHDFMYCYHFFQQLAEAVKENNQAVCFGLYIVRLLKFKYDYGVGLLKEQGLDVSEDACVEEFENQYFYVPREGVLTLIIFKHTSNNNMFQLELANVV